MVCLKCGRDAAGEQVFCDSCLSIMEESPVKPGTPVLLPSPKKQTAAKKAPHRKRALSPEEQVIHLRKAVGLGMATALLVYEILQKDVPAIGQNYTIDTTMNTE